MIIPIHQTVFTAIDGIRDDGRDVDPSLVFPSSPPLFAGQTVSGKKTSLIAPLRIPSIFFKSRELKAAVSHAEKQPALFAVTFLCPSYLSSFSSFSSFSSSVLVKQKSTIDWAAERHVFQSSFQWNPWLIVLSSWTCPVNAWAKSRKDEDAGWEMRCSRNAFT